MKEVTKQASITMICNEIKELLNADDIKMTVQTEILHNSSGYVTRKYITITSEKVDNL